MTLEDVLTGCVLVLWVCYFVLVTVVMPVVLVWGFASWVAG